MLSLLWFSLLGGSKTLGKLVTKFFKSFRWLNGKKIITDYPVCFVLNIYYLIAAKS